MTYLEFYQAWSELVMQNVSVITIPEISCSRATLFITIGIETILFFLIYHNRIISNFARAFILLSIYLIVLLFTSLFLYPSSECQKSEFNPIPAKIIYEYPDKDYTVEEFEKNMATLSSNAISEQKTLKVSPEQIEQAKTVLENCLKNLPYDYQVNHSSIVRRCIADEETKRIFEQKDTENEIKKVEIYKDNFIKKLRNIH